MNDVQKETLFDLLLSLEEYFDAVNVDLNPTRIREIVRTHLVPALQASIEEFNPYKVE